MTALSMWRDGAPGPQTDGPAPPDTVDVAVVGAGLTGLTTAVLLARAGVSVAVLEGRTVSAGTTGASTAKISLLQGTRLSTIGQRQPLEAVRRYVDANRDAQAWLVELCESRGVPLQRVPALTFAVGASGERRRARSSRPRAPRGCRCGGSPTSGCRSRRVAACGSTTRCRPTPSR